LLFHCCPGDAVSYPIALFGATILIFSPGVIEGSEIYFLRVQRQMRPNAV
jgi:hypothetical protein